MSEFFANTRPGKTAKHDKIEFELPILYFRDDLFLLFFTADYGKIKALMPTDNLYPVTMPGGRAMLGIAAFNYIDTTIGPYGEVGVVIPAIYGKKGLPGIPAVFESKYPGFGTLVMHLPVTKTKARDAGRSEWGYTKFVADMKFINTPEYHQVEMGEQGAEILTMRVAKKGYTAKDNKPLVTYSVKNGDLIQTTIPQQGICRKCFATGGSFLKLGDHEVADSIKALDISDKPIQSRYYLQRSGILPAGRIIESGVRPLEGYYGKDREGEHVTEYLD